MIEMLKGRDGWYQVSLADVPEERRESVAANMAMVGEVLSDGQVTMEEAAQLLALAYPDLSGQLAPVLEASERAVLALRDDGKVSLLEAIGILSALMAGVPSLHDLAEAAKVVASRVLQLRRPK